MRNATNKFLAMLVLVAVASTAAHAVTPLLKEIEDAFIRIGEKVRPAVVNVDVEAPARGQWHGNGLEGLEDFFRYFGIPRPQGPRGQMPRPVATGSGFIYDKQGHVITNNHVVANAGEIKVRLANGDEYDAEVVGSDPQTDIAVIKLLGVDGVDLPASQLGNSDDLKVGQFAVALGSPRGLEGSLSFGHVTALGREDLPLPGLRFRNLIQTDAAINLGNSGGPLCDIDGRVIGINVAIVYGAQSLGFAIPVNTAKKVVPTLISEGRITRGYLGVVISSAEMYADAESLPDKKGAFVQEVSPGAPAADAGLQVYDIIRKVDGNVVEDDRDLVNKISDYPPGSKVALEVWRDGEILTRDVALGEFPTTPGELAFGKRVLGLSVQDLTPEMAEELELEPGTKGVIVAEVEPGSAADEAGIVQGDVILEVAKRSVANVGEFRSTMKEHAQPGKQVLVRVARGRGTPSVVVIKVPADQE